MIQVVTKALSKLADAHYGATSCEACRGFFKRSIRKEVTNYICKNQEKCEITKIKRARCPFCRFQKCLASGMQSDYQVPEQPVIKKQTRMNLRRSKSFSDVREPTEGLHLISTPSTNVPDWDYKTRFCSSQEKHNTLEEEYKIVDNLLKDEKAETESEISSLQQSEQTLRKQVLNLTAQKQILTKENEDLLNRVFNGEKLRRELHNCFQDLKGNIQVFCRLRPPINKHEKINMCNFNFANENSIEISKMSSSISPQEFTFDKVFNQDTTQAEIFEELSQLIQSAMDGYHVCVFAYGQTGSGKTYTMQGESDPIDCLGMIPRSVQFIFARKEKMEKMGWSYTIKASFLEIYNETIRDLLNTNSKKALNIQYDGNETTVSNLTVMPISSAQELLDYMYKSQQNRSTAVTNFNEHSSRSHAVTKIYIEARYRDVADVYIGSVSLVDLAGSESAKSVSRARLAEMKNIHKSLSSLGNVMTALYKKESHIPYRNSKLTFLLQSSLGGNCKCLMIVNISPLKDSYNETINALRFADKVKTG